VRPCRNFPQCKTFLKKAHFYYFHFSLFNSLLSFVFVYYLANLIPCSFLAYLQISLKCKYFIRTMVENIPLLPVGIRWICRQLSTLGKEKNMTSPEICNLLGDLLFLRFISPAIVYPVSHLHFLPFFWALIFDPLQLFDSHRNHMVL